jgi:integrase
LTKSKLLDGNWAPPWPCLSRIAIRYQSIRYVPPTVETVETYARHWIEAIAPATRQSISVERYASILRAHIIPGLGEIPLQKLDPKAIDAFYGTRRARGLASHTIHHIHSVLKQILASAVKARKLSRSPIDDIETAPKPKRGTIEVLDEAELGQLLDHLRGHWLYMPVLIAAYTGMRRGEILGLRWQDFDPKRGTVEVTQAAESVGGKLRVKAPKTARSARTIKLPASLVAELERHRKVEIEKRLGLGIGGKPELVFTDPLAQMIKPDNLSLAFVNKVAEAGVPAITFHGLRHTHITALLKAGTPVIEPATRSHRSRSTPIRICSAARITTRRRSPRQCSAKC